MAPGRSAAGPADRVLVETVVEIDFEITVITVRDGPTGVLHFCEAIGHRGGRR